MVDRQRSGAQWRREEASKYQAPADRKDGCTHCAHFFIKAPRAPFCSLHRIFVHKLGMCPSFKEEA